MKKIESGSLAVMLDEETLGLRIEKDGVVWNTDPKKTPELIFAEGTYRFLDAEEISHEVYSFGVGCGIRSRYAGFAGTPYAFETIIWIEAVDETFWMEWIPLCEEGLHPVKVLWPTAMEFTNGRDDWYTLLTEGQGLLIPNTWKTELGKLSFDGRFETSGGYMPWFGQVKERCGYTAICTTPWNAGYQAEHPAGGPYTSVGAWLEPSLGTMNYRRVFRYTFLNDCDYNDLCKTYRQYVREQGHLRTLKEKAVQNPSIHDLVGTCFVHTGIKTVVQPESGFFDPQNPEKNNRVVPFSVREQQIREIHDLGVEKVYLHLDGWAEPGYDNKHPDYTPACQAAGGWEDMKSLVDTMHDFGYKFGIHDQYRDYYHAAPSYDENYACRLPDRTIPGHSYWAGGPQSYLCATQAPFYVKRNFAELKKNGIRLDGAYLDVFTCNEGDECANPEHVMTRRDCYTYRGNCFSWLLSQGILSSSEEVSDWAVPYLVFCHYAPYDFMLRPAETPKKGIPVPLFNLVYHDCVIEPWMMDRVSKDEDYMLYALLAGGAPYLVRDGAYPNTDGAFDGEKISLEEMTERCRVVTELHEKTALLELVRHECMTADGSVQKSEFSDGTYVICDFAEQIYEIGYGE